MSKRSKADGDTRFERGGLYHLLANRLYLGEIVQRAV